MYLLDIALPFENEGGYFHLGSSYSNIVAY